MNRKVNTFADMITQLTHAQTVTHQHTAHIAVVCDNITSQANIGMVFRVCEAMGAEMLYICGHIDEPNKKTQRVARSTAEIVPYKYYVSTEDCISELKIGGYEIVAIELTDQSEDLRVFTFDANKKYAFIAGSEKWGISHEVLQLADAAVMIPHFGQNSSMNVATAISICLFECVRQLVPVKN